MNISIENTSFGLPFKYTNFAPNLSGNKKKKS
jgi:hypothetical protein